MRVLPNMTVVVPCDALETEKATMAIANLKGPCFIRFGREAVPVITQPDSPFEIGKANVLREGKDVTIMANGAMVYESILAAEQLAQKGIEAGVINLHTVKPLDTECILKAAKSTGVVVTVEEHQKYGGMGGAVAEFLGQNCPVPMGMVAVEDCFGESGTPDELMNKYGLKARHIVEEVLRIMERKSVKV